jgi:hypothetical protein
MVELVDTKDLKSFGLILRAGSSPALGINKEKKSAFGGLLFFIYS